MLQSCIGKRDRANRFRTAPIHNHASMLNDQCPMSNVQCPMSKDRCACIDHWSLVIGHWTLETDLRTEEKGLPIVFPLNVVPMTRRALVEPEHRVVDVEHLCLDLHVGRRVVHDRAVELP